MIVAFETQRLRDLCEDPRTAVAEFGVSAATSLRARLADLRAAVTISDLLVGDPHLSGPDRAILVVVIGEGLSMLWVQNDPKQAFSASGWYTIRRIRLIAIDRSPE